MHRVKDFPDKNQELIEEALTELKTLFRNGPFLEGSCRQNAVDLLKANREHLDEIAESSFRPLLRYFRLLRDLEEEKGVDAQLIDEAVTGIEKRWTERTGGLAPHIAYVDSENILSKENAMRNAVKTLCDLPPVFEPFYRMIMDGGTIDPKTDKIILELNLAIDEMKKRIKDYEPLLAKYWDAKIFEQTFKWDGQSEALELRSTEIASRLASNEKIDVRQIRKWMKIDKQIAICDATVHKLEEKQKEKGFSPEELKSLENVLAKRTTLRNKRTLTQSSPNMWHPAIMVIVNELKRAGLPAMDAYRMTATLLNLRYPDIYTNTDPKLVRQHYQNHKKNSFSIL